MAGSVVAVGVLLVVLLVRSTWLTPVRIASRSMEPTYQPGEVVLVVRHGEGVTGLRRGDVVVFHPPGGGPDALKRVVGLPGETLVVLDGRLVVDGVPVREPYVDHDLVDGYYSATFTVPPASVFVMGDNRGNSVDSRDYGPLTDAELVGRVVRPDWLP